MKTNCNFVEKDTLLSEVWTDTFVTEATLAQNISTLRKILGTMENGESMMETVPRHGYRFKADVREINGEFRALHFGSGAGGGQADFAVPGDYDGDGRTDQTIRRVNTSQPDSSLFWVNGSTAGIFVLQWGTLNMEVPNHTLQVCGYRPSVNN